MNYKSSDLYLSAYLRSKGYILEGTEKHGNKTIFVFQSSEEEIKPDVISYFNGRGSIEPLRFVDAIRNMKSLTYNS